MLFKKMQGPVRPGTLHKRGVKLNYLTAFFALTSTVCFSTSNL